MNNCTMNTYEMKREISKNLNKLENKFIKDIEYGIAVSVSLLISNISTSLN